MSNYKISSLVSIHFSYGTNWENLPNLYLLITSLILITFSLDLCNDTVRGNLMLVTLDLGLTACVVSLIIFLKDIISLSFLDNLNQVNMTKIHLKPIQTVLT